MSGSFIILIDVKILTRIAPLYSSFYLFVFHNPARVLQVAPSTAKDRLMRAASLPCPHWRPFFGISGLTLEVTQYFLATIREADFQDGVFRSRRLPLLRQARQHARDSQTVQVPVQIHSVELAPIWKQQLGWQQNLGNHGIQRQTPCLCLGTIGVFDVGREIKRNSHPSRVLLFLQSPWGLYLDTFF